MECPNCMYKLKRVFWFDNGDWKAYLCQRKECEMMGFVRYVKKER